MRWNLAFNFQDFLVTSITGGMFVPYVRVVSLLEDANLLTLEMPGKILQNDDKSGFESSIFQDENLAQLVK